MRARELFGAAAVGMATLCAATPAVATHPDSMAWQCWLSMRDASILRCLADPVSLGLQVITEDRAARVVERAHVYVRTRMFAEAEELLRDEREAVPLGAYWSIPLHGVPHDSSWRDGRVERLARAGLCRGVANCVITLARPETGGLRSAPKRSR